MTRPILMALTMAVVFSGCGTRVAGDGPTTARQQANRITEEEVRTGPQTNAYDLVQGLRSQWLRPRGPGSQVMVYLDGVPVGGTEELRRFNVADIIGLEFMDPIDAMSRYGMGHENGVINILSRRRSAAPRPAVWRVVGG
jgi:hypothetical protein